VGTRRDPGNRGFHVLGLEKVSDTHGRWKSDEKLSLLPVPCRLRSE
jgi:hypothetical protein